MNNKIIRLTESDLHNIIRETVMEVKRNSWGRPGVDKKQYKTNKEAPIGSEIICATCGTPLKKKTKAQAFCSRVCKDKYHNGISTDRHKDPNYYNKYNKQMGRTYADRFGTNLINKTFDGNKGYDYDDWEDYSEDEDLDYYNGEELLGDYYPGDND